MINRGFYQIENISIKNKAIYLLPQPYKYVFFEFRVNKVFTGSKIVCNIPIAENPVACNDGV